MASCRSGIQRYLRNKRDDDIDIKRKTALRQSSKSFKCMRKELKRQGLAAVEHQPPISDDDLSKLYEYLLKDHLEDVQLLQYKVFLDLMLHFGSRRRVDLANLTRSDCAVKQDDEGSLYVYQTKDEHTKNHQDDLERSSDGRMYEKKGNCPTALGLFYKRNLIMCYHLQTDEANVSEALLFCSVGGLMFRINTVEKQTHIAEFLNSRPLNSVFIGGLSEHRDDLFSYEDGSPLNPFFWMSGNPRNFRSIRLRKNTFEWIHSNGVDARPFLCEITL